MYSNRGPNNGDEWYPANNGYNPNGSSKKKDTVIRLTPGCLIGGVIFPGLVITAAMLGYAIFKDVNPAVFARALNENNPSARLVSTPLPNAEYLATQKPGSENDANLLNVSTPSPEDAANPSPTPLPTDTNRTKTQTQLAAKPTRLGNNDSIAAEAEIKCAQETEGVRLLQSTNIEDRKLGFWYLVDCEFAGETQELKQTFYSVIGSQENQSFDPLAENNNNPPGVPSDYGMVQVNGIHADKAFLMNPINNVRIGYQIYLNQGLNAWSAYSSGRWHMLPIPTGQSSYNPAMSKLVAMFNNLVGAFLKHPEFV